MEAEGSSQPLPVLLLRPAPRQLPSSAVSRGSRSCSAGGVGSDVQLSALLHEIVDPTAEKHAPMFSGLPERPENPMIRDPLFGQVPPTPTPADYFALAAALATPTCPKGHRPGKPCAAPEGFCCLDYDYPRHRVAAGA
ncbi:hypothetical protein E2562_036908 [Oryza meyeriana var. granulata]|uniref:Uncharacterized protein n=1 Tax=Oryza meyeriana var. granulata TaxID=110450 RepID=A0A6G1E8K8_9ORYZ|nr:hypothetical protein E2562_036908 [Oryza meyeriana var. granulata]